MMIRILALALAMAAPAAARDVSLGRLRISNPVLRVASPVSKTGAGYMAITNGGKADDRLLAVTTTAATRSDLHGSVAVGTVMQMRAQAGGVPIPAGATVRFAPGGLHIMFIGIKATQPPGSIVKARLQFERAGTIEVAFTTVLASQQP